MCEKSGVGDRIRQLREARELSVAELAEQSHTSVELVERLESGELVPSLSPLMQIARALGVRLGTFLDDAPESGPVVVRAGHAERVVHFSGGLTTRADGALEFFPLASHKPDRHMEPFVIDVHPPETDEHPLSSHEGEEFIYVLAGQLEVCYGKDRHTLEAGDSIYYDSIVPHHVHAAGGADARILAVVYAPL